MKLIIDGIDILVSDDEILKHNGPFAPKDQPMQTLQVSPSTESSNVSDTVLEESDDDSLVKLISLVANNCSITIKNLHSRYEHS